NRTNCSSEPLREHSASGSVMSPPTSKKGMRWTTRYWAIVGLFDTLGVLPWPWRFVGIRPIAPDLAAAVFVLGAASRSTQRFMNQLASLATPTPAAPWA